MLDTDLVACSILQSASKVSRPINIRQWGQAVFAGVLAADRQLCAEREAMISAARDSCQNNCSILYICVVGSMPRTYIQISKGDVQTPSSIYSIICPS